MANFVQSGVVKTAVRELAAPIEDVTAFAAIVNGVRHEQPVRLHDVPVGHRDPAGRREDARGLHGPDHLRERRGRDRRHGLGEVPDRRGLHRERRDRARERRARVGHGRHGRARDRQRLVLGRAPLPRRERRGLHGHVRPRDRLASRRTPTTRSSRPSRPGPTPCRRSRKDGSLWIGIGSVVGPARGWGLGPGPLRRRAHGHPGEGIRIIVRPAASCCRALSGGRCVSAAPSASPSAPAHSDPPSRESVRRIPRRQPYRRHRRHADVMEEAS